MLIEFSVANFRSIKDKITLSMVTNGTGSEDRRVFETGFKAAPKLIFLSTYKFFIPF